MQPLQYDLRSPAAKDNSITKAALARSNLDATITMRSAVTELQSTIELRAIAGSGTDFVWKNIGFRASAISQKRISCETSSKFTMRERSYSCKSQWKTDSRMIRGQSENDPTTPETVSHPSHRRGRSSRFGDRLCMEKHRVSCICYLSKTHFVRDFLQIYNAGTILQLQITLEDRFENDPRTIRE